MSRSGQFLRRSLLFFHRAPTNSDDYLLIMLIEAALGTQYETLRDHYMEEPQKGSHSTLAKGSSE